MKLYLFLLLVGLTSVFHAQEKETICQEKTTHFTNCYTLSYTKVNKGLFKQIHYSDDGKVFYGYGKFKLKKRNLVFKYSKSPLKATIQQNLQTEKSKQVLISWENILGTQDNFQIECIDSLGKKMHVNSSIKSQKASLETSKVLNSELILKEGEVEILRFKITNDKTSSVHISASNTEKTNKFNLKKAKLKLLDKDRYSYINEEGTTLYFYKKK